MRRFLVRACDCNSVIADIHVNLLHAEEFGYQENDIVMLTDDQANPRSVPTRANMVRELRDDECELMFHMILHFWRL